MLNSGVFSFSVFADEDSVDIVISRLEALDRDAGSNVRKQVEGPAKGQIERDVALPDYAAIALVSS